ncbi:MAG: peptidase M50 [Ignavibacteria bacterium]|nr:MAG: peptidase M50 [Ignavibacteria bacterium]KAF0161330.1 MAG: peptidase M50 [Ignavibacteria bacterium]
MEEKFQSNQKRSFAFKLKNSPLINLALFLVTIVTTTIAGVYWSTNIQGPIEFSQLSYGLPYAASILLILGVHEFGHYFAAVLHKVKVTLPYFIPFPPLQILSFGTMGAVIKTKTIIPNNKAMFDIGASGPIAGFFVCLAILIYGFTNLPTVDYILAIHPDYFSPEYGKGAINFAFGDSLLFTMLRELLTQPGQFVPPMSEIYHYPYLCAGWFGLFVTSMNLIPVGQLDGGHIIYSMFGEKKHEAVASVSLIALIILGVSEIMAALLEINFSFGWSGWLFWALILYFIIKVKHTPVTYFEPLGRGRMAIGIFTIIIFILSFSPSPFIFSF